MEVIKSIIEHIRQSKQLLDNNTLTAEDYDGIRTRLVTELLEALKGVDFDATLISELDDLAKTGAITENDFAECKQQLLQHMTFSVPAADTAAAPSFEAPGTAPVPNAQPGNYVPPVSTAANTAAAGKKLSKKTIIIIAAAAVIVLALIGIIAGKGGGKKSDPMALIQGDWACTSLMSDGQTMDYHGDEGILTISDDHWELTFGKDFRATGTCAFDSQGDKKDNYFYSFTFTNGGGVDRIAYSTSSNLLLFYTNDSYEDAFIFERR